MRKFIAVLLVSMILTLAPAHVKAEDEQWVFWWYTYQGEEVWVPESFYYSALAVAQCESRWNPDAVGKLGEASWFQIHPIHAWRFWRRGWGWSEAWDPGKNTVVALEIWEEVNWRPWSCRP